jgi:hypothetical protein
MYDNHLITLDVYSAAANHNGSAPDGINNKSFNLNSGLSIESINSSSGRNAAGRRRQLPQIPLDKQRESREKGVFFS